MSDRRNPYLILGVDYGCSPEVAAQAFARTTRRLRRDPDAPYTVEDATWALHQIEQAVQDPAAAITAYRVPADPTVFEPIESGLAGAARTQPLGRTTPPSEEAVDALRAAALLPLLREELLALAELGLDLCYRDPDRADEESEPSKRSSSWIP